MHSAPQINDSLVRLKGPFLGADLHPGSPGAQGRSKARSGTGATRSEASMARTHPLTRPSTRRKLPSGRVASDQVQLPLLTTYQRVASGSAMPIKKPAPDAIKKRDHFQNMPACSPSSKVILGLDNQHGIYRNREIGFVSRLCRSSADLSCGELSRSVSGRRC